MHTKNFQIYQFNNLSRSYEIKAEYYSHEELKQLEGKIITSHEAEKEWEKTGHVNPSRCFYVGTKSEDTFLGYIYFDKEYTSLWIGQNRFDLPYKIRKDVYWYNPKTLTQIASRLLKEFLKLHYDRMLWDRRDRIECKRGNLDYGVNHANFILKMKNVIDAKDSLYEQDPTTDMKRMHTEILSQFGMSNEEIKKEKKTKPKKQGKIKKFFRKIAKVGSPALSFASMITTVF
jgi:hypothetical protein